jgi:PadR family transcriptional regulator, regulatory protein AphA
MSLEYAILGFLRQKPLSGYDLKALFDRSVRHFWPADQSQIYRALARLAEKGWATVEVVEQDDRPDRKLYHLTETGRSELHCWLAAPVPIKEARSAALIQLFFAAELTDNEVQAILRKQAEHWRSALKQLGESPNAAVPHATGGEVTSASRRQFFALLTLDCGIATCRAQLDWIESVIARVDRAEVPNQ